MGSDFRHFVPSKSLRISKICIHVERIYHNKKLNFRASQISFEIAKSLTSNTKFVAQQYRLNTKLSHNLCSAPSVGVS